MRHATYQTRAQYDIGTFPRASDIQEDALPCTAIFFRYTDWAKCEFLPRYAPRRNAVRIRGALLTRMFRVARPQGGVYEIPIAREVASDTGAAGVSVRESSWFALSRWCSGHRNLHVPYMLANSRGGYGDLFWRIARYTTAIGRTFAWPVPLSAICSR